MRARAPLALIALTALIAACDGGTTPDDTDTGSGTDTAGPPVLEDYINVTDEALISAGTCWTPGDAWIAQQVNVEASMSLPGTGLVADFESGSAVFGAFVEVFNNDDASGTADETGTTDQNGHVELTLPTCTPTSYRVSTADGETKNTYEAHQFYISDGSQHAGTEFNSVSRTTYQIIPSILGISPDPTRSIIAGTAFDCVENPIQNAQVVVKIDGQIADGVVIKYFVDEFPNRDQPATSPDGLWIAINVPPGLVTVEMYGVVGGGAPQLLGTTQLPSRADSINIANIYYGIDGGVKYPSECLVQQGF